jgi:hypothetical protein
MEVSSMRTLARSAVTPRPRVLCTGCTQSLAGAHFSTVRARRHTLRALTERDAFWQGHHARMAALETAIANMDRARVRACACH